MTDDTAIGTNAPVSQGNWGWSTNAEVKIARFPAATGRYVFLRCKKGADNRFSYPVENNFKVNELWLYTTASAGPQFVPVDVDSDGTDDYLLDWGPPISVSRPAQVTVPNSQGINGEGDCCNNGPDCDSTGEPRRQAATVSGGVAGVEYIFEAVVEAKVEQYNNGYDIVGFVTKDFCLIPAGLDQDQIERRFFFLEGNNCTNGCTNMLVLTVTNEFTIHAFKPLLLEYNPVDFNWHQDASATNASLTYKSARQSDLP